MEFDIFQEKKCKNLKSQKKKYIYIYELDFLNSFRNRKLKKKGIIRR